MKICVKKIEKDAVKKSSCLSSAKRNEFLDFRRLVRIFRKFSLSGEFSFVSFLLMAAKEKKKRGQAKEKGLRGQRKKRKYYRE
jgi:hypothetical protein